MTGRLLALLVAAACGTAPPLFAGQRPSPDDADTVIPTIALTALLTTTTLSGSLESGSSLLDVGGADANHLGLSTSFDIRVGRAAAMAEFKYTDFSDTAAANGSSTPTLPAGRLMTMDAIIGYRLVERPKAALDLQGGIKIFWPSATFTAAAHETSGVFFSDSWGDGILGAHFGSQVTPRLFVDLQGMAGGQIKDSLGASHSWQIDAAGGYRVSHGYAVVVRYYRLHSWRSEDAAVLDLSHSGLLVGVRISRDLEPRSR